MAVDMASFDSALKEIYKETNYNNVTMMKRPLLALLPKFKMFGGRLMPIPTQYADPQNQSASFDRAIESGAAGAGSDQIGISAFQLTRVSSYGICQIGTEVAEASEKDEMAFLTALKAAIDGTVNSLSNRLETQLFREGTGSIGSCGGGEATVTFTLSETSDVANFEVGMRIVASAGVASGASGQALIGLAAGIPVTGVNRTTGGITKGPGAWNAAGEFTAAFTSPAAGPPAVYAAHLYPVGDAAAAGDNVCVSGLGAWLPETAPAAGAGNEFFGVDRAVDSRLYGQSFTPGAVPIEDALIDAASLSERVGGSPDLVMLHHVRMRELVKNLHNSQQYDTVNAVTHKGVVADIGFRSVNVQTGDGKIDVVSASRCPENTAWLLQKDTWLLATLGEEIVELQDLDGMKIQRVYNADAVQARFRFRGNLANKGPIYNVRINF